MNRKILRLAVPNIISNISIPLLGIVDMALMGHMESDSYIGAIALGSLIFNFFNLEIKFSNEIIRKSSIIMLGRIDIYCINLNGFFFIVLFYCILEGSNFHKLGTNPSNNYNINRFY